MFTTGGSNKRARFAPKGRRGIGNKNNVRMGLGFPKKITFTHKYHETVNLTVAAGVVGIYNFSCNGMFDPNITGTGHQPLYYDQMTALYDHYTVIGSKMRVKLVQALGNQPAVRIATYINDDATVTPARIDTLGEQSSGKQFLIPPASVDSYTLTNSWSAKKTFGGSVLGNDNLQGTSGTNPTEQSYYTIAFQAADESTTVTMFAEVDITYIAVWDELRDVSSS